ncbi:hypothetical protein C8Q77DRAFT_265065 [Trametes polyzona]|nr:hypothetical protein C8Q77DRAFT_265065 [Trametes polyzona]
MATRQEITYQTLRLKCGFSPAQRATYPGGERHTRPLQMVQYHSAHARIESCHLCAVQSLQLFYDPTNYIWYCAAGDMVIHKKHRLTWIPSGQPPLYELLDRPRISTSSQLAKGCINKCACEHELCCAVSPPLDPSGSPPRLIGPRPIVICMRTGAMLSLLAYVVLSYTWGAQRTDPSYCTTTTPSLRAWITLPPISPRTNRGSATRALGFPCSMGRQLVHHTRL